MKLTSIRTLALVLLASAIVWLATPVAADPGRDLPRCLRACSSVRAACDDRCVSDCAALYPNDHKAYTACREACHQICVTLERDCKLVCRKPETSGPIP